MLSTLLNRFVHCPLIVFTQGTYWPSLGAQYLSFNLDTPLKSKSDSDGVRFESLSVTLSTNNKLKDIPNIESQTKQSYQKPILNQ